MAEKREWVVELSLTRAKRLAQEGRLDDAYDILAGLVSKQGNSTIFRLQTLWREQLRKDLKSRFPNLELYPRKNVVAPELLREAGLKSREMFVLGLYDGVTSIDDAVAISPVDDVDTLRATARLVDLGLLTLD